MKSIEKKALTCHGCYWLGSIADGRPCNHPERPHYKSRTTISAPYCEGLDWWARDTMGFRRSVGMRIARAIEKECMTIDQVAELSGLHRLTISHLIHHRCLPTIQSLIALAVVLHTTTDYLLGLDGFSNHNSLIRTNF